MTKKVIVPVYHPINGDQMGFLVVRVDGLGRYLRSRDLLHQIMVSDHDVKALVVNDSKAGPSFYGADCEEIVDVLPSPDCELHVCEFDDPADYKRFECGDVYATDEGVYWVIDEHRKSGTVTWQEITELLGPPIVHTD